MKQSVPRWSSALLLVGGFACFASAARRHFDLGDLLTVSTSVILILAGVVSVVFAVPKRPSVCCTFASIPAVLGAVVLIVSVREPLIISAAALVMFSHLFSRTKIVKNGGPLEVAALGLIIAFCAAQILDQATLLYPTIPWLSHVVASILNFMGVQTGSDANSIVVNGLRSNWRILTTPSLVGLLTSTSIAITLMFVCLLSQRRMSGKTLLSLFVAFLASVIIRMTLSLAYSISVDSFVDYDNPNFPLAAFFDWRVGMVLDILAASAFLPIANKVLADTAQAPPARDTDTALATRALTFAFLGGLAAASPTIFDCFGTPKTGTLAVEEAHSEWEATDLALDETLYGEESGYNYRAFIDWLAMRHGPVRRIYGKTAPLNLSGCKTLIIKTPTRSFDRTEIETIVDFVRGGGGLLLIGDHTNVFGSGEALNPIAKEFGFTFAFNCMFDERRTFEHVYKPDRVSSLHPILRDLKKIRFEVGCTIATRSLWTRPVIVGRGIKTIDIDYAASNFYPFVANRSDMWVGQASELVVRPYGKGRVVGLSDSTFISTFSVCFPGRRELMEDIIDWLGRTDSGAGARTVFFCVALLLIILTVGCVVRLAPEAALSAMMCFLAGWSGGGFVSSRLFYTAAPPIQGVVPGQEILFNQNNKTLSWPVDEFVRDESNSYSLFFQWCLRVGLFPKLCNDFENVYGTRTPLVIVDPADALMSESHRLLQHVEQGNIVFFIEVRPNTCVREIARQAGFTFDESASVTSPGHIRSLGGIVDLGNQEFNWVHIGGGVPLLMFAPILNIPEICVASMRPVGKGSLIVVTCGELFTDTSYGSRYDVTPDPNRRLLYEIQFSLLRACASHYYSEPPSKEVAR